MPSTTSSPFRLPPVYPLTPDRLDGGGLLRWAGILLDLGCTLIQYRRKKLTDGGRLAEIESLLTLAANYGAEILVDDRCDLCRISGAHGVHLGQGDLPPGPARDFLGPAARIGVSTHDLTQLDAAMEEPVDYIALGPVFPTRSKADPDPVVFEGVQEAAVSRCRLPLVAIGGITPDRARECWARGFRSVAVLSALDGDPRVAWKEFLSGCPPVEAQ